MIFLTVGTFLVTAGCVGNSVSFIVLQTESFRKSPSSAVLSALAVADTAVLLTSLLRHCILAFSNNAMDVRGISQASCKVHTLMTYFLMQLSAWTLVVVTTARLISTLLPFRSRVLCSRRRLLLTLLFICIALFLVNFHIVFTVELHEVCYVHPDGNVTLVKQCHHSDQYAGFWFNVWPWIDSSLCSIIPGVVILIQNIAMVRNVMKARKTRRNSLHVTRNNQGKTSVTAMLIAVSMLFIATNIPIVVYMSVYNSIIGKSVAMTMFFHVSVTILMHCNHSFNFVMYCVFGRSKFGRELRELFHCHGNKHGGRQSRLQSITLSTFIMSLRARSPPTTPRERNSVVMATDHPLQRDSFSTGGK